MNILAALLLMGNAAASAVVLTVVGLKGRAYVYEGNVPILIFETTMAWASFMFGVWYLIQIGRLYGKTQSDK